MVPSRLESSGILTMSSLKNGDKEERRKDERLNEQIERKNVYTTDIHTGGTESVQSQIEFCSLFHLYLHISYLYYKHQLSIANAGHFHFRIYKNICPRYCYLHYV